MLYFLIQLLSSEFKLQDLDAVHYFLGIEVQSTGMGLMLHEHKYILDILTRADMTSCKPDDTPISLFKVTILSDNLLFDPTWFHQIVSGLQYLTFTHPNICLAINRICQFIHAPINSHWVIVKHIIRYLKVRHLMVSISLKALPFLYRVLQMQIELIVLIIVIYGLLPYLIWSDTNLMEIWQATHSCSLLY